MPPTASGPITVSLDPPDLDVARIHRWLSEDTYWASGRPLHVVETAVAASTNVAALDESGMLVGYARIVGDGATYAWICDVYVDPAHRGAGVGVALMTTVHEHLTALRVDRAMLATEDAHSLYTRFGFDRLPDGRFLARSYRGDAEPDRG